MRCDGGPSYRGHSFDSSVGGERKTEDCSIHGRSNSILQGWSLVGYDAALTQQLRSRVRFPFLVPLMRQWFIGKIQRCHRWAPCSILGWRMN